jgi:hypothetical protein
MNASIDDSPSAIGPQSLLDVLPSLAEPLPRELNNLIAQLIAFETRKRGIERPTAPRLAICYGADGAASSVDRLVNRTTA